jgi:hypothetical protein
LFILELDYMSTVIQHPPELLLLICAHIYSAGLPASSSSLDPLVTKEYGVPTAFPSSLPPSNWWEPTVRKTLSTLCLVNHSWYEAAKPWLWQKVEVRLPRSWLSFVEEISGGDDEEANDEQAALVLERSIQVASDAALARSVSMGNPQDEGVARQLQQCVLAELGGPDGSIPPELLTPPASRDPSPRRLSPKSKSPARWKMMRSISNAVQNAMELSEPGVYGASICVFILSVVDLVSIQSRRHMILALVDSSATLILIISVPSVCAALSRKVSIVVSLLVIASWQFSKLVSPHINNIKLA